jgi:hypothetical protein
MNPLPSRGRPSWPALAAIAGLLFAGALGVTNRVELARLAEAKPGQAQEARFQALAARLAELAGEIERARPSPDAVPLARYEADREAVERRLAAVEQADNRPPGELEPLRERLAHVEEALARAANPPADPPATPNADPPPPSHAAPRPRIAEPPFRAIGVERRADERFLVLLPGQAAALSQARLLRVGDAADGWRLEAIDDKGATFSQGGRKHRLRLTGETK